MDGKAAFTLGLAYKEIDEDEERVHVLMGQLGSKLPRKVASKRKMVTDDVLPLAASEVTEERRRDGLLYGMKVHLIESVMPLTVREGKAMDGYHDKAAVVGGGVTSLRSHLKSFLSCVRQSLASFGALWIEFTGPPPAEFGLTL